MKKLSEYLEYKIRSILEEEMDSEGNPVEPIEDLEILKKKAKTKETLNKIAKEEVLNLSKNIDFSIETEIGDITTSQDVKGEDANTINKIVKEEINSAIKKLKDSESEFCDIKISYIFKEDPVELRAYFSFDKEGNIKMDDVNIPSIKKIKTIKEFLNKWNVTRIE